MKYLISTDLDGTLLDHHDYTWQAAQQALDLCRERKVPVILNTSKTLAEVDLLQADMGIEAPMIVENGSALVLPLRCFNSELDFDYLGSLNRPYAVTKDQEVVTIVFGAKRSELLTFVEKIRADYDWGFSGFHDWSVSQIAETTGLSSHVAKRASRKQYSEPLVWNDSQQALTQFIDCATSAGFKLLQGGRFYHLQGKTDKAVPLAWLQKHISKLYSSAQKESGNSMPKLICLGDTHNDVDMLNIADNPVCVRSPVADFPKLNTLNEVVYTEQLGPQGWNQAVSQILGDSLLQTLKSEG